MKTVGNMIVTVIASALVVGGGTYFYFNQKMGQQKDELAGQIKDLQGKVAVLGQTPTITSEDANAENTEPSTTPSPSASPSTSPSPSPSASSTPTPSPVDTKNWKTYSNTKYTYSVQYPTDWVYKDTTATGSMSTLSFQPKSAKDYPFSVTIQKSTLDYTIGLIKKQYATDSTFNKQSTADVNGKTFTTLNFTNKANTAIKPTVYLLAQNDLVYFFTDGTSTDKTIANNVSTIAKSFQLTK